MQSEMARKVGRAPNLVAQTTDGGGRRNCFLGTCRNRRDAALPLPGIQKEWGKHTQVKILGLA